MQHVIKQDIKIESTIINDAIERNSEIQSYTATTPVNQSSSLSASEEEEQ